MDLMDERIIELYRHPRWKGLPKGAPSARSARACGDNSLCGDTLTMEVAVEGAGRDACVSTVRFDGYGCSLCLATADLLAERARGARADSVAAWEFQDVLDAWGGLKVGRSRAACARLPLRVLQDALAGCVAGEGR